MGDTFGENSNSNPKKFWIQDDYYFYIDDEGRSLATETYEGSFGYVIQLHKDGSEDGKPFRALKIPKLIGVTFKENAFINHLMGIEVQGVQKALSESGGGLLQAWSFNTLKTPLVISQQKQEVSDKFHEGIVLVKFQAGKNPQFEVVKKGVGGKTKPPSLPNFEQIKEKSTSGEQSWSKTIFVLEDQVSLGKLIDEVEAAKHNIVNDIWCTCLPSVVYQWAQGSLQQSVSRGEIRHWKKRELMRFIERICQGIDDLHKVNLIHADIRPANILYVSEPGRWDSYYLADYGSFSSSPSLQGEANHNVARGYTVIGPVTNMQRVSVFYSPERIRGVERELANKAMILSTNDGRQRYLLIGWDKDLKKNSIDEWKKQVSSLKNQDTQPKDFDSSNVEEDTSLNSFSNGQADKDLPSGLGEGDYIKVQEYVLRLNGPEVEYENVKIIPFDLSDSWEITSGHVTTHNSRLPETINLDKVIEYYQWSAATDLYSLGTLILYMIYRGGELNQESEMETKSERVIEDNFLQMMQYITSSAFFGKIWPELESLRLEIEHYLKLNEPHPQPSSFEDNIFRREEYFPEGHTSNVQTLGVRLRETIKLIIQSVPGSIRLVEFFDYDLSSFFFIFHFALSCIHRKDNNRIKQFFNSGFPFCNSRTDPPQKNGAAYEALKRIRVLYAEIINDNRLRAFVINENDERENLSQASQEEFSILQSYFKLQQQNDDLQTDREMLTKTQRERKNKLIKFRNDFEETKKNPFAELGLNKNYKQTIQEFKKFVDEEIVEPPENNEPEE